MHDEVLTMVRLQIVPLAEDLRTKHRLSEVFHDVRLEGDSIVFYFRRDSKDQPKKAPTSLSSTEPKRERKSAKRRRMRTRGWPIITKITTSKGQTAMIYQPLVDAIKGKRLSPAEQRAAVAKVLRSNGNVPNEPSVEYYLRSTLDYLDQLEAKS